MANWSEELFTIRAAHPSDPSSDPPSDTPSDPPVYQLTDDLEHMLDGTFYEPELHKVPVPKD